ncbi:MAG: coiled-coil domain-containing protein [Parvibaculales bacterium]
MSELAIDTHRFIKRLMENGFTEAKAETLADTQMAFLESRLATKDELREVHLALKSDIVALRTDMQNEIAAVHARIDKVEASVNTRIHKLEARLDTRIDALESQFRVMLLRSQFATGAAIVTILTFIDYITP